MAGSFLILSACASAPPPPTSALDSARMAIANAERANAGRFAAVEIGESRDKFALANTAVGAKQMELGARLADEARVSADLAYAKTESAKAVAINKEMALGAEALTEEMRRAGAQQ
jgi:hypothetical protein